MQEGDPTRGHSIFLPRLEIAPGTAIGIRDEPHVFQQPEAGLGHMPLTDFADALTKLGPEQGGREAQRGLAEPPAKNPQSAARQVWP